jgi:hypothetical protein
VKFAALELNLYDYQKGNPAAKIAKAQRHYKTAASIAAAMVKNKQGFDVYDEAGVCLMTVFSDGSYMIDLCCRGTEVWHKLRYIARAVENARRS